MTVTPMKAIRAKCLDCSCGSSNEVKECPVKSCPLYVFRFGKNPNIPKRILTEEQRQAAAERMFLVRSQLLQTGKTKELGRRG